MCNKMLRPDSKGRITLGALAEGVSGYHLEESANGQLTLTPHVEIPAAEQWLFHNKKALAKVKSGLTQAMNNQVISKGSFANYSDD